MTACLQMKNPVPGLTRDLPFNLCPIGKHEAPDQVRGGVFPGKVHP